MATHTLGCRLNQFETEKIAAQISGASIQRVEFAEPADLYIINTCTVTHKADATCRQVISNVARRKGKAKLVVLGCYVESDRETVAALPGVDMVIGNREKNRSQKLIANKWPELFANSQQGACADSITVIDEFRNHSRAWLKISDGCNQRCAFCIIPTVRGALRNNSTPKVIRDINNFAQAGYHEVVLTGVHIGHFKDTKNGIKSLTDLLQLIIEETDLTRLRISSLEPQVVDDKLLQFLAGNTERICRHFHLPLQSGSNRILSLMRRPYNRERYLQVIGNLKRAIPGITIGGDVIVGFPGETDADFADTAEITDSGFMDYLHVFTYSDRDGTRASAMPDKCDPRVVAKRHKKLRAISDCRWNQAHAATDGVTVQTISENFDKATGRWWSITDNYLRVLLPEGLGDDRQVHTLTAKLAEDGALHAIHPDQYAVA